MLIESSSFENKHQEKTMEDWMWVAVGMSSVVLILYIVIKLIQASRETSSENNGSEASESEKNLVFTGIIGLIGIIAIIMFAVWFGGATVSAVTGIVTKFSSPSPCQKAGYSQIVWEGWLEPGVTNEVYDLKFTEHDKFFQLNVKWRHDLHPVFYRVNQPESKNLWIEVSKSGQDIYIVNEGMLELMVESKDTKTYVWLYYLDI